MYVDTKKIKKNDVLKLVNDKIATRIIKTQLSYVRNSYIYVVINIIEDNEFEDELKYWNKIVEPIYIIDLPYISLNHRVEYCRLFQDIDDKSKTELIVKHEIIYIHPKNEIILKFDLEDHEMPRVDLIITKSKSILMEKLTFYDVE